ncbi:hypothetical protein [Sphingomonas phage Birtae]|nr:hypothetical protein [Sphingomonas phage Birtae]
MAVQVHMTNQVSMKAGVKCLVYGKSGVGKTRLIASAPKPFVISAERGLLSLRHFQIPVIQVTSIAQLREAYEFVLKPANRRNIGTLALDSGSEIAEVCLAEEKRRNKDPRKAYGEMGDLLVQAFRDFRDIEGMNVVFLAKNEAVTDGATGSLLNQPSFPGKQLGQAAPYFFDEVFQLNNFHDGEGKKLYALRTSPDPYNVAKDRSGILAEWENADPATGGGLTNIFNRMLQG